MSTIEGEIWRSEAIFDGVGGGERRGGEGDGREGAAEGGEEAAIPASPI